MPCANVLAAVVHARVRWAAFQSKWFTQGYICASEFEAKIFYMARLQNTNFFCSEVPSPGSCIVNCQRQQLFAWASVADWCDAASFQSQSGLMVLTSMLDGNFAFSVLHGNLPAFGLNSLALAWAKSSFFRKYLELVGALQARVLFLGKLASLAFLRAARGIWQAIGVNSEARTLRVSTGRGIFSPLHSRCCAVKVRWPPA